jgi:hypothetical protein
MIEKVPWRAYRKSREGATECLGNGARQRPMAIESLLPMKEGAVPEKG